MPLVTGRGKDAHLILLKSIYIKTKAIVIAHRYLLCIDVVDPGSIPSILCGPLGSSSTTRSDS